MLTPADLIESFNNPQTAHAAIVHAPIVLTAVAAVLALVSALFLAKNRTLRWMTFFVCVAAAGGSWGAKITGETVYDQMGDPPAAARQVAHEHEELGEQVALIATVAAVLALGAWLPRRALAGGAAWVTVVGAGGAAFWAASAGGLGGELVYDYGLGTPKPVTERDLAPVVSETWGDPRLDRFVREVRPVLTKYCLSCHGSDDEPANGLRLSTAAGMLIGGDGGPAIVPGDAGGSLVFQTISGTHPEIFMPPSKEGLTVEQVEIIRQWIDEGAVWMAGE